jgi:hypothetical protein
MYSKAEVRIIQDQQVEDKPQEVTSSEASALLAKYGYSANSYNSGNRVEPQKSTGPTAEELYAQFDREMELKKQREYQQRFGPKAYTFDNSQINYSSTDYRSLDDGFGVQVQIVSDMPIYNGRR